MISYVKPNEDSTESVKELSKLFQYCIESHCDRDYAYKILDKIMELCTPIVVYEGNNMEEDIIDGK